MKCLFHAVTLYHLLEMMSFRLACRPEAESVLVIYSFFKNTLAKAEELENFFDQVVVLDDVRGYDSQGELAEKSLRYYDSVFSNPELSLDGFDEIFVAGAQFTFGQYLASREIPFVFVEEAAGFLSTPEILANNDFKILKGSPSCAFCERHGLYDGSCSAVIRRCCNRHVQTRDLSGMANVEHFSVVEALEQLPDEVREKVVRFFLDDYPISVPENSVLLFTEHQANLLLMSLDDQCLIYQLFVDYFFPDRELVIKPHPSDLLYYEDFFPEARIVRQRFPAELIPFVFTAKPAELATIYSTAVFNLSEVFDRIFVLTPGFENNREFRNIHRNFVAVELARRLLPETQVIHTLGADGVLLKKLAGEFDFREFAPEEKACVGDLLIVGHTSEEMGAESFPAFLETLPEDRVVIFLNPDEDYPFYAPGFEAVWDFIVPLEIRKRRLRQEEFYSDCDSEIIYIYTKNQNLRKIAAEFIMEKELKNTGVAVSIEKLTPDQLKIKVLEGIISSMEVRMRGLIEENRKLSRKG